MMRTCSFIPGVRVLAVLGVLACGFPTSLALATDDEPKEIVPGLDLWTREHQDRPVPAGESGADLRSRSERHRVFREEGVPIEYRSHGNPYPAAEKVIQDGGKLYRIHCIECHGPKGLGDGQAGRNLATLPAMLAQTVQRPRAVDEYLFWSISEGGVRFGTDMPAFKEALSEREIWQIVEYMREGFPAVEQAGAE